MGYGLGYRGWEAQATSMQQQVPRQRACDQKDRIRAKRRSRQVASQGGGSLEQDSLTDKGKHWSIYVHLHIHTCISTPMGVHAVKPHLHRLMCTPLHSHIPILNINVPIIITTPSHLYQRHLYCFILSRKAPMRSGPPY